MIKSSLVYVSSLKSAVLPQAGPAVCPKNGQNKSLDGEHYMPATQNCHALTSANGMG
jgi:hypothetical protein